MTTEKKPKVYLTAPAGKPPLKAIREKCTECAESPAGVRECRICKCPLWSYRFGSMPESAIGRLLRYYDVRLVNVADYDYVEETKGKRLAKPRPEQIKAARNGDGFEDEQAGCENAIQTDADRATIKEKPRRESARAERKTTRKTGKGGTKRD